jgi:hypothetical protein
MKKILLSIILTPFTIFSFSQIINISTGVAAWKVTPTGGMANVITPHYIWVPQLTTPLAVTGAQWISPTTSYNVVPGNYIYETKIIVGSFDGVLKFNFQVAADDVISGLELENPSGSTIKLAVPTVMTLKAYSLRKATDTTIICPQKGEWKIKARVRFIDNAGGFILSGNVEASGNCDGSTQINSTCCPPWNKDVLKQSMVYKGTGGIADPYTLIWNPSALFQSQMQAYLNYLNLLDPTTTMMSMEFRLHNQGANLTPNLGGWGPQIGTIGYNRFTKNTTGVSSLMHQAPISYFPPNAMLVGNWYAITTGIYTDGKVPFFGKDCGENTIYFRIQVIAAKSSSINGGSTNQFIEFSDGKKIISIAPIETEKSNALKAGEGRG